MRMNAQSRKSFSIISLITLVVIFAGALVFNYKTLRSGAPLTDTNINTKTIGQAKFNDILTLTPSTSKARYFTKNYTNLQVATIYNAKVGLDFGEIKAGSSHVYKNVLKIKNIYVEPVDVKFKPDGKGISIKIQMKNENTLSSGQTKDVTFKFNTNYKTAKNVYKGKIIVYISKTSLKSEVPFKITVI